MILTNDIEMKISPSNIKYFRDMGYENLKLWDIIVVSVKHLSEGCNKKIKAACDICGKERYLIYNKYLKNISKYNIYTCSKCKMFKTKQTKLDNYGDENYNNIDKRKQSLMNNYGVENVFQLEDVKEKSKETKLNNHGDENYNNRDKFLETMDGRWEELLAKGKQTNLERYGDENFNNPEKNKATKLKNHEDENYVNVEQYKQTSLKNWGVEHPSQNIEVFNKMIKSRFKLKDYILPSGKIVKVQGYEPRALDILFQIYKESDLLIEDMDIENKIGKIFYNKEGKKCRYYPDIYIISENKIIEVKSFWTFECNKEINILKEQSCLDMKMFFEFMIFQ